MTYWYPGVFKLIEITKKLFKNVPIILGGIYATLCYEHAKKYSGVDIVFNGSGEVEILKLISGITKFRIPQFLRARGLSLRGRSPCGAEPEPEAEIRIPK